MLLPGWKSEISTSSEAPENEYESTVKAAFERYFAAQNPVQAGRAWHDLVKVTLPTSHVVGVTDFHDKIYTSLTEDVPVSTTVSYSGLAELAGNPLAARAAGTAMRKNPLPIIVPCHRVISADGSLGGYMGQGEDGLVMKKWLLHHEGALN